MSGNPLVSVRPSCPFESPWVEDREGEGVVTNISTLTSSSPIGREALLFDADSELVALLPSLVSFGVFGGLPLPRFLDWGCAGDDVDPASTEGCWWRVIEVSSKRCPPEEEAD